MTCAGYANRRLTQVLGRQVVPGGRIVSLGRIRASGKVKWAQATVMVIGDGFITGQTIAVNGGLAFL